MSSSVQVLEGAFGTLCMNCMAPLRPGEACSRCGGLTRDNAPHQLRAGTVLVGRYLVGNVIGQGGFGITYIGYDLTLNMRVAVKEYYPNGFVSRSVDASTEVSSVGEEQENFVSYGKRRFLDEARVLAQFCGDPGVVEVRDFFEANGTVYIVMEYLDGEDLRHKIKNQRMASDYVFELMQPVMDVLEKIHAHNIVHRDISPDNIMLMRDGSLRLMDFGAARLMDLENKRTVSIVLKAGYAPEEQYRSKGDQGPWTDIYALCATMYKAITGKTPEDSLQRLYKDEVKWPSELGIPISEVQEQALKIGMCPRADGRFRSIGEMRAFLEGKLDDPRWEGAQSAGAQQAAGGPQAAGWGGGSTAYVDVGSRSGAPGNAGEPMSTVYVGGGTGSGHSAEIHSGSIPGAMGLSSGSYASSNPSASSGWNDATGPSSSASASVVTGEAKAALQLSAKRKRGVLIGAIAAALVIAATIPLLAFVQHGDDGGADASGTPEASQPAASSADAASGDAASASSSSSSVDAGKSDEPGESALPASSGGSSESTNPGESSSSALPAAIVTLANYRVRYVEEGTETPLQEDKVVAGQPLKDPQSLELAEVVEQAPGIDGFDLVGDSSATLKLSEDEAANVITFHYKRHVEEQPAQAQVPVQTPTYQAPAAEAPSTTGGGTGGGAGSSSVDWSGDLDD